MQTNMHTHTHLHSHTLTLLLPVLLGAHASGSGLLLSTCQCWTSASLSPQDPPQDALLSGLQTSRLLPPEEPQPAWALIREP